MAQKPKRKVVQDLVDQRGEIDAHEQYIAEERFFGVNPLEFFEDVSHVVDTYLSDCADAMADFMKQGKVAPRQADHGADNFVRFMMKSYDPNIDRFQMYCLRNLFAVPHDLQFPDEMAATADASESSEGMLDQDISALHARVRSLKNESQLLNKQCAALDSSASSFEQGAEALMRSMAAFERHGISNVGESMAQLMESFNEAQSLERRANSISERLQAGPGAAASGSRTIFRPRTERVRDADALACGFRAHQAAMGSRSVAQLTSLNSSLGIC